MRRPILALSLIAIATGPAVGDPAADSAVQLYRSGHYDQARAALAQVVRSEPNNAEACHCLGMAIHHGGDRRAHDEAAPWLERAIRLAPDNADYLADYAGNCLLRADDHRSYALARRGRDAMIKAVQMNPRNRDGHFGLVQFFAEAPWPLGSKARAFEEAAHIVPWDRPYAVKAYIWLGRYFESKRDRKNARRAYQSALALDPDNASVRAALSRLS